jgi:hypothetical protein
MVVYPADQVFNVKGGIPVLKEISPSNCDVKSIDLSPIKEERFNTCNSRRCEKAQFKSLAEVQVHRKLTSLRQTKAQSAFRKWW